MAPPRKYPRGKRLCALAACGVVIEFSGANFTQKYCSYDCYALGRTKVYRKVCPACASEFVITGARGNHDGQRITCGRIECITVIKRRARINNSVLWLDSRIWIYHLNVLWLTGRIWIYEEKPIQENLNEYGQKYIYGFMMRFADGDPEIARVLTNAVRGVYGRGRGQATIREIVAGERACRVTANG